MRQTPSVQPTDYAHSTFSNGQWDPRAVGDLPGLANSVRSNMYADGFPARKSSDRYGGGMGSTVGGAMGGSMAGVMGNGIGHGSLHARNDSAGTGTYSNEFGDPHGTLSRRHDYDVQEMETALGSPRTSIRNPIPPPTVTVRSEFPTLTRSRQQQSLTCLITVEVTEGKWHPTPVDIGGMPNPSNDYDVVKSPSSHRRNTSLPGESQQELDRLTEELHSRVENWHGLEFSR